MLLQSFNTQTQAEIFTRTFNIVNGKGRRAEWECLEPGNYAVYEMQESNARKPLTDAQIKARKPVCADFESFRAGVRCIEIELGIV